jgi:hypothetical protein
MGALLVPIIVVVAIAVVMLLAVRTWASGHRQQAEELASPREPTLDYLVPDGQDPVVLLTVLSADGYAATADPATPNLIRISCPAGLDRERARVRATIQHAGATAIDTGVPFEPDHVRFVDET